MTFGKKCNCVTDFRVDFVLESFAIYALPSLSSTRGVAGLNPVSTLHVMNHIVVVVLFQFWYI